MAKESSFDIVSQVNFQEIANAIQIAEKEIANRYDFRGSKSSLTLEDNEIILISDDEFKLGQLKDVLLSKLIRRDVPIKNIQYEKPERAAGGTVRQRATLIQGIDKENAKKINRLIKDAKYKVKTQIQNDQLRVSGKSKDELQKVIATVRAADLPIAVQFINYR